MLSGRATITPGQGAHHETVKKGRRPKATSELLSAESPPAAT